MVNILDIIIILFLILGAYIGFKDGFAKSLVKCLGIFVAVILAFVLKNPMSEILMTYLPFIEFSSIVKGAVVLNILVYEVISFVLILIVLLIGLRVLNTVTGVIEKILELTIIFGMPSKILGLILGVIRNYSIVFVILFILSTPTFENVSLIKDSTLRKPILESTPLVSIFTKNSSLMYDEFNKLSAKYENEQNGEGFNYDTLQLLLKYNVVKTNTIERLVERGKINISNIDELIQKYKED